MRVAVIFFWQEPSNIYLEEPDSPSNVFLEEPSNIYFDKKTDCARESVGGSKVRVRATTRARSSHAGSRLRENAEFFRPTRNSPAMAP